MKSKFLCWMLVSLFLPLVCSFSRIHAQDSSAQVFQVYYVDAQRYPPLVVKPLLLLRLNEKGHVVRLIRRGKVKLYEEGDIKDAPLVDRIRALTGKSFPRITSLETGAKYPPFLLFQVGNSPEIRIKGADPWRREADSLAKGDVRLLLELFRKSMKAELSKEKPYFPTSLWVFYEKVKPVEGAEPWPSYLLSSEFSFLNLPYKTWRKVQLKGEDAVLAYRRLLEKTFFGTDTLRTFLRDSTFVKILIVPQ